MVHNTTTDKQERCTMNPHWDWRWNEGWKRRGSMLDVVPVDFAWLSEKWTYLLSCLRRP